MEEDMEGAEEVDTRLWGVGEAALEEKVEMAVSVGLAGAVEAAMVVGGALGVDLAPVEQRVPQTVAALVGIVQHTTHPKVARAEVVLAVVVAAVVEVHVQEAVAVAAAAAGKLVPLAFLADMVPGRWEGCRDLIRVIEDKMEVIINPELMAT